MIDPSECKPRKKLKVRACTEIDALWLVATKTTEREEIDPNVLIGLIEKDQVIIRYGSWVHLTKRGRDALAAAD